MRVVIANIFLLVAVFVSITIFEACGQQHSHDKISNDQFTLPKDSAVWDFQLTEKYYSRALIRLLEDGIITRSEGATIDKQHAELRDLDSNKLKAYVFVMQHAINEREKPLTPLEFYDRRN